MGSRRRSSSSVRLRFPRESLLPVSARRSIRSREEQREFLDRFLSIAQTTWSEIERERRRFERFLDPDTVPPKAMAWLGGLARPAARGHVDADAESPAATGGRARCARRGAPRTACARGCACTSPTSRASTEDELEARRHPRHRRELRRAPPPDARTARARRSARADGLWSPSVERRFQVGVFDRDGEVELVSHRRSGPRCVPPLRAFVSRVRAGGLRPHARRRSARAARDRAAEAGPHDLRAGAGRAALSHRRAVDDRARHASSARRRRDPLLCADDPIRRAVRPTSGSATTRPSAGASAPAAVRSSGVSPNGGMS